MAADDKRVSKTVAEKEINRIESSSRRPIILRPSRRQSITIPRLSPELRAWAARLGGSGWVKISVVPRCMLLQRVLRVIPDLGQRQHIGAPLLEPCPVPDAKTEEAAGRRQALLPASLADSARDHGAAEARAVAPHYFWISVRAIVDCATSVTRSHCLLPFERSQPSWATRPKARCYRVGGMGGREPRAVAGGSIPVAGAVAYRWQGGSRAVAGS